GDHRHAGLDAGVLAGEANLLGIGFLPLEAELGPRREDQLHLVAAALGLALRRRLPFGRRGGLSRRRRRFGGLFGGRRFGGGWGGRRRCRCLGGSERA